MCKFIKNFKGPSYSLLSAKWLVRRLSLYKLTVSANSLADKYHPIVVVLTVSCHHGILAPPSI